MNRRIKKKWLKALRSGCYQQATGQLLVTDFSENDQFCCLGVLCNIHAEETNNHWSEDNEADFEDMDNYTEIETAYLNRDTTLPREVQKWAGLNTEDPIVKTGGIDYDGVPVEDVLSNVNDSGTSFAMIADMIEKSL